MTTEPLAAPRRVLNAVLVIVTLVALVLLLATGRVVPALVVGVVAVVLMVLSARPRGG